MDVYFKMKIQVGSVGVFLGHPLGQSLQFTQCLLRHGHHDGHVGHRRTASSVPTRAVCGFGKKEPASVVTGGANGTELP